MFDRTNNDVQRDVHNLMLWGAKEAAYRSVVIRHIAADMARRDVSDQHVYSRVSSHLSNNITSPQEYGYSPEAERSISAGLKPHRLSA